MYMCAMHVYTQSCNGLFMVRAQALYNRKYVSNGSYAAAAVAAAATAAAVAVAAATKPNNAVF